MGISPPAKPGTVRHPFGDRPISRAGLEFDWLKFCRGFQQAHNFVHHSLGVSAFKDPPKTAASGFGMIVICQELDKI